MTFLDGKGVCLLLIGKEIESHYFLQNLQIFFHGSPDFPLSGVGRSVNRTGLIAKISIKYVLPTCIWKYFWRISRYFAFFGKFRGISRKYLNFAGPRPREISEALPNVKSPVQLLSKLACNEIILTVTNYGGKC